MSRYGPAAYPDKDCSHSYSITFHSRYAHCQECDTFWKWWVADDGYVKGWYCIPASEGRTRFGRSP